jgi:beta-xylosidase
VRFNASRLVHGACLAVLALAAGRVLPAQAPPATAPTWARAVEGQRKADLGNGTFLNPIMAGERWWSKGHATIFEGPGGQWYAVYLAHENGFYNLGRQTLVEPMAWTADGWLARTAGSRGRLARAGGRGRGGANPQARRAGRAARDGALRRLLHQQDGHPVELLQGHRIGHGSRYRYENRSLVLKARGATPADSSPLWFVCGDHAYEVEVEIDRDPGTTAGLLVFYNSRLYAGLGVSDTNVVMHRYGMERTSAKPPELGRRVFLRLTNDRHIVTIRDSADGVAWKLFGTRMEVSGYHHNVAYDFLSLRPALYAAGSGEVRFRHFTYRALP